jgi:hypothetical protein
VFTALANCWYDNLFSNYLLIIYNSFCQQYKGWLLKVKLTNYGFSFDKTMIPLFSLFFIADKIACFLLSSYIFIGKFNSICSCVFERNFVRTSVCSVQFVQYWIYMYNGLKFLTLFRETSLQYEKKSFY